MRFRPTWIPAAFIAALALIVILPTAQSQEEKKEPLTAKQVGEYMRKGDKLVKDGELAEGGRYYYTITVDHPDNGEAQLKLARLYKELGEIENSAGAYALAAEHLDGKDQAEAYAGLTEAFVNLGKYQEAAIAAPKAIAADPSRTDAHVYLAMSLAKTGQYAAAAEAAETAIGLAPDNPMAQASLGVARLGTGDMAGAEDAFNKALALDASLAEAHAGMADIMLSKQDYDGAVAAATKAIELNSKLTRAYAVRGIANNARGETELAYSDLAMAVTVDPNDFASQLAFAEVYEKQGNLDMAVNYYRKAAELSPGATDVTIKVARISIDKGDAYGATEFLKKALEANASSADLHYLLGLALVAQDQIDPGIAEFDAALAIEASMGTAHFERGKALLNKKQDAAGALPSLQKAVDLEPENADFLTDYGAALMASQRMDEALAALTKAASSPDYKNPVGLYNLGRVQLAKQDYPAAKVTLKRCAEAAPSNWGAPYVALAWANFGMIKPGCPCDGDEAIAAAVQENYKKAVELGISDPNLQPRVEALAKGEKIK